MPFAEPSIGRRDALKPLLLADSDSAQHLPVEEGAEGAGPGVVAHDGEGLADEHHVCLCYTYIESPLLIDGGDTSLKTAGRCQVGVDGDDAAIAGKYFHCRGDDLRRTVLLFGVYLRQCGGVVPYLLIAGWDTPGEHRPDD